MIVMKILQSIPKSLKFVTKEIFRFKFRNKCDQVNGYRYNASQRNLVLANRSCKTPTRCFHLQNLSCGTYETPYSLPQNSLGACLVARSVLMLGMTG